MEVVTVLGAGLLVGTSLTVIIPEGVNTLFSMETSTKGIFCLFQFFSAYSNSEIILFIK